MRTLLLLGILLVLGVSILRRLPRVLDPGARRVPWDPWAVLGVREGASAEEVTRAYRDQLKRYHPDRVADLGPELQQVAHQKTLDIQRAYDELSRV